MRIAFADFSQVDWNVRSIDTLPLGGAHSAAIYLARALARQGQTVFYLSSTSAPGVYDGITCLTIETLTQAHIRDLKLDALICLLGRDIGPKWRSALGPAPRLVLWNHHTHESPLLDILKNPVEQHSFDGFVTLSQWQRDHYLRHFGLDPARTALLRNAIAPAFQNLFPQGAPILAAKKRPPLIVYTSAPFRGLNLLVDVFPQIAAAVPGTRLQVFSSVKLYGQTAAEDQKRFGDLYARCRNTPGIDYVGSIPQSQLAHALRDAMVLAYPNTFEETSCIAAMEAMAAGCQVVTSALAALPETTAGFARLIPTPMDSAAYLRQFVDQTVAALRQCLEADPSAEQHLQRQVAWINQNATWDHRAAEWIAWLSTLPSRAASPPPTLTAEQAIALAFQRHQSGNLAEAEALCRRILTQWPNHPDALHLLGILAFNTGKAEVAGRLIMQAIQARPNVSEYYSNLSAVLEVLGRIDDAVAAGQQAVNLRPDSPTAWYNFANALRRKRHLTAAANAYRRSIQLDPKPYEPHSNLAATLKELGNLAEAIAEYRAALMILPNSAAAHNNLGDALREDDQIDQAIELLQNALVIDPNYALALNNLGTALLKKDRREEAVASFRRAIELQPDLAEAHNNLANIFHEDGDLPQAIAEFQLTLKLSPDFAQAWSNFGNTLKEDGQLADAIAACRKAIALRPDYSDAHYNLANALMDDGQQDQAIAAYDNALRFNPASARPNNNKGSVFKEQGLQKEAIECYELFLAEEPDNAGVRSNRIYVQLFLPDNDPAELLRLHRQWDQIHAQPLRSLIHPHENDPSPDRPLRIGYLSPDLRFHSVAFFLLPLLESHDKQQVHVTLYSSHKKQDAITDRLKSCADRWRDITDLTDEESADIIRRDQIDILVDLASHTAHNRLLVFARKPAPVQVAYLGYPGTTGMEAMDWRLTDAIADPPGAEEFHTEKLRRLPRTAWCFEPLSGTPPIQAEPRSHVVFGSFNDLAKVNEPLLRLWARILHQTPDSHLLLKNRATASATVRRRVGLQLADLGIAADRIEFVPPIIVSEEHLQFYNRIDIALDTYPYHGTTTTCESLWMGVPVVTLAGKVHVSRVGASLLGALDLTEFIAPDEDQYIRIATQLAADGSRRRHLRATLRDRMKASPLMDAPGLARAIEAAYRQMWHHWVQSP